MVWWIRQLLVLSNTGTDFEIEKQSNLSVRKVRFYFSLKFKKTRKAFWDHKKGKEFFSHLYSVTTIREEKKIKVIQTEKKERKLLSLHDCLCRNFQEILKTNKKAPPTIKKQAPTHLPKLMWIQHIGMKKSKYLGTTLTNIHRNYILKTTKC